MEEKVEGNNQTTPETESKTGNEVIKPAGELANAMSQQNCKFQTSFASPEDDFKTVIIINYGSKERRIVTFRLSST